MPLVVSLSAGVLAAIITMNMAGVARIFDNPEAASKVIFGLWVAILIGVIRFFDFGGYFCLTLAQAVGAWVFGIIVGWFVMNLGKVKI